MATKTITIRDYIKALRANGYPQVFNQQFQHTGYDINGGVIGLSGACAYGQVLLNLGAANLYRKIKRRDGWDYQTPSIVQQTIFYNDTKRFSLDKIADQLEEDYKTQLDQKLEVVSHDYSRWEGYKGLPTYE